MDPPSNAEAFVHRCGRTARIGNKGAAVVLLSPSEESYIDFLSINQRYDKAARLLSPSLSAVMNRGPSRAVKDRGHPVAAEILKILYISVQLRRLARHDPRAVPARSVELWTCPKPAWGPA